MTSNSALNEEVHHILELSNVLGYLFNDRSMCDTQTCIDLLKEYIALVHRHLEYVEKNFYSDLLKNPDSNATLIANNFMSGSVEIKRVIRDFTKQWCTSKNCFSLNIKDYARFTIESETFFEVIVQRIQDETEHLYPLVRGLKLAS